ncbi:MAG: hypothetical protein RLZZ400_287 [Actinomycetota bacterium]|jgi:pimeloyl-ACP methyl ester carboxylesterase
MELNSKRLTDAARARASKEWVELPSAKTAVWKYPATSKSQGNILLIHGYRGTHHGLEGIVGSLDDFDCYAPDLPGFGESSAFSTQHSIENYSTWMHELVAKLDLDKPLIVGHSFGTLVVSRYANQHQEFPIVLINPISAPALTGPRSFLTKVTSAFYRFAKSLGEKPGRWLLSHPIAIWSVTEFMYRGDVTGLKPWIAEQHKAYFSRFASTKSVVEGFEASISCTVGDFAPRISQPTLLICCERDDVTKISAQRQCAEKFNNATYVEVPKLGHLIHYEGPEIAATNIRDFYQVVY